MDQITLISPHDIESLPHHIRFSRLNLPFIKRTLYIVPKDKALNERIRTILDDCDPEVPNTCKFIEEDEILSPSVCENKWIYQQLLKLSVYKLHKTHALSEPFLFTDIDTVCLRPLTNEDLMKDGKYKYWVAEYQNTESRFDVSFNETPHLQDLKDIDRDTFSWLMSFSWSSCALLGLETMPAVSAVNACTIWYSSVLYALTHFLEKRFGKPFHEVIVDSFKAFIKEHKDHFYEYTGFRKIVMSYYGGVGLTKCDYDEDYYMENLRLGFSEWQLYTLFLSVLNEHPYVLHFQAPNENEFISEFNSDVLELDVLRAALRNAEAGGRQCHFINFYPNINKPVVEFLETHYERSKETTT